MDVKIQLDERSGTEIGEERLCAAVKSRKLRKRRSILPTPEVKDENARLRTTISPKLELVEKLGGRADFTAPGWLRLGNRRNSSVRELVK